MEIGYITDFFGNTLEKVKAPEAGVILYKIGTPPVNKGETLVVIGKVDLENCKKLIFYKLKQCTS